jgi:hypothetical protein
MSVIAGVLSRKKATLGRRSLFVRRGIAALCEFSERATFSRKISRDFDFQR